MSVKVGIHSCVIVQHSHTVIVATKFIMRADRWIFLCRIIVKLATFNTGSGQLVMQLITQLVVICWLLWGHMWIIFSCSWDDGTSLIFHGDWHVGTKQFLSHSWWDHTSVLFGWSAGYIPRPILSHIRRMLSNVTHSLLISNACFLSWWGWWWNNLHLNRE